MRERERERERTLVRSQVYGEKLAERVKFARGRKEGEYGREKPCQRTHRIILSNPPAARGSIVASFFSDLVTLQVFCRGQVDYISDQFLRIPRPRLALSRSLVPARPFVGSARPALGQSVNHLQRPPPLGSGQKTLKGAHSAARGQSENATLTLTSGVFRESETETAA